MTTADTEIAPPNPFIDRGACPGEGCIYRAWTARQQITLYDKPKGRHVVAHLRPGEHVIGITGEVRCIPLKLVASEDLPNPEDQWRPLIRKGQAYYVLHYLGEGAWLVWFRGKLTTIENPLQRGPFPKAVWWVKVKTSAGVVGWAISDGNFDGQCSIARSGSQKQSKQIAAAQRKRWAVVRAGR